MQLRSRLGGHIFICPSAEAGALGAVGGVEIVQDFVGVLLPLHCLEPLGKVRRGRRDGRHHGCLHIGGLKSKE